MTASCISAPIWLIGQRNPACVATTIRYAAKSIETRFVTVADRGIFSVKKYLKKAKAQGLWRSF
jgi:hypothetical protein